MDFEDLAHEFEAADTRHLDVGQHQVERLLRDLAQRVGGIVGGGDVVADPYEDPSQRLTVELFVVDDENA